MTKETVKQALKEGNGTDIAKTLKEYFVEKAKENKTGQLAFETEVKAVFSY